MVTQVDLYRCANFIEKVRIERFNKVKARQVRSLTFFVIKTIQIMLVTIGITTIDPPKV